MVVFEKCKIVLEIMQCEKQSCVQLPIIRTLITKLLIELFLFIQNVAKFLQTLVNNQCLPYSGLLLNFPVFHIISGL